MKLNYKVFLWRNERIEILVINVKLKEKKNNNNNNSNTKKLRKGGEWNYVSL